MHRATIALSLLVSACATTPFPGRVGARGTLYSPVDNGSQPAWTDKELREPAALRNLRRSPEASFHVLRVRSEQAPHVHDRSDLVLMTLAGNLDVTIAERTFSLSAGDVLEISRGTPYAVRSQTDPASVAYLVFTPALSPDDYKAAGNAAKSQSAWQWNLWTQ